MEKSSLQSSLERACVETEQGMTQKERDTQSSFEPACVETPKTVISITS